MAKSRPVAHTLDLAHARARWHVRQGLATPVRGGLEEVVRSTGWVRTLAGIDIYLAVRARFLSLRRLELDEAVARGDLQIVPAVRGCIYLVPRSEVPLVLRIAEEQWRPRTERELSKAGSSWQEVQEVADGAASALAAGPATPDALRKALPSGLVRSLGEAGKKLGMASVLPVALRLLEFEGRIDRTLPGGRLDSQNYTWRSAVRNPFEGADVPADAAQRHVQLASAFFRFAAPATVKEFAEWSGLSQRDARAAVERLELLPVSINGHAEEAWALEEDLRAPEPSASISFLPFEDNFVTLHGGPAPLTDPAYHHVKTPAWGSSRGSTLGDVKHMSIRAVLEGDRVAGLWEYDQDAQKIVVGALGTPRRRADIEAQADALAAFVKEELGHARSFSLDTDESVRQRVEAVRAL